MTALLQQDPNGQSIEIKGIGKQGFAIQPAIWPETGISTEVMPYISLSGPAGLSLGRGGIVFGTGGMAVSDGYFNLFNLGKWRDLCGELPIALQLNGEGRFHLSIHLAIRDRSVECIFSEVITLDGALEVPLDLIAAVHPCMVLYFELRALADGQLADFAWATSAPPRQAPDLLLSVTTFKREAALANTVERFRQFRDHSPLRDHVRMVVVDNGQSVTIGSGDGVTVVQNANLGGAGGFARGLLEARSSGATHCLFMDDDASVHMGAITRTWMLLAYATDPRTAVAGAMINGASRWKIWENGAVFDRGCRPLFFNWDMRERRSGVRLGLIHDDDSFKRDKRGLRKKFDPSNSILEGYNRIFDMEFSTTGPAPKGFYSGWWFCAFPVAYATYMPFPFFVRGDDVSFSLANDFRFVTLPGVASFQESFTDKASPLTWYLDLRSHLAHHLSLPEKHVSWYALMRMVRNFYLRTVLRFHYDSLSAVNLAMEDVLRGPQFFADNADMVTRRQDLKALTTTEAWTPTAKPPHVRHGQASRPLRALLLLTINGHLLPFSTLLGSRLVIEAQHRENFKEVYGARQITYLNVSQTASYTVTRNSARFWRESLRLLGNSLKMLWAYKRLCKEWQDSYSQMTSETFWQKKLVKPDETP